MASSNDIPPLKAVEQDRVREQMNHDKPTSTIEPPRENIWHKMSEHILALTISIILFGTVASLVGYGVSYFINRMNYIEMTIAKHHGPEWHTIEKVVAIGELRNEFVEAKNEYDKKLKDLEESINENIKELQKYSKAIVIWTKQGDAIMREVQAREHDAYAHLTTKVASDEDVAAVNVSHIKGTSFKVGDRVIVRNDVSGLKEQIVVRIVQQYSDLDHTDVLLQLGPAPAKALNFSQDLGKLKINARKEIDEEKRWHSYDELLAVQD